MSLSPFTYSAKLWTALLIGPAKKCPIASSVRFLIQKLFWASDEGIKIALCIPPRHDISIPFKFGELLGSHCSFSSISGQFSCRHCWEIYMQCAQRPMHLVESATPSGISRLHSSMNFGSRN